MKNVLSSFNWIFTSGRRFQLLSKNLVIEIRVLTVISQKKYSWLILLWQESPGSFVNSSLEVVLFTEKANQNFCLEKLSIVTVLLKSVLWEFSDRGELVFAFYSPSFQGVPRTEHLSGNWPVVQGLKFSGDWVMVCLNVPFCSDEIGVDRRKVS